MWWQQQARRLNDELAALQELYPQARYQAVKIPAGRCLTCREAGEPGKHLAVFATIETFSGGRYPVGMVYPCNFPQRMPAVWFDPPLDPRPPKHLYADGRPCLTVNEYDPAITGVITLGWTHGWLNCYEIWRRTGIFPDQNHGGTRLR